MSNVTYANFENELQSILHTIVSEDSTVKSLAKVFDGRPKELTRGRGAYVLIHCPEITDSPRMTNNEKFRIDGEVHIECVTASDKESIVRRIAGAVRNALRTNQTITRGSKVYAFKVNSSDFRVEVATIGRNTVNYFTVDLYIGYKVRKV